jgi:hypothetical protein
MARLVYCDHHLTSEGWISGTERYDDGTLKTVETPGDSALTIRFTSPANRPEYMTTQWRTDNEQKLKDLIAKYGELPEVLRGKVVNQT